MDGESTFKVEFLLRGNNIYEADAIFFSQAEEPQKRKGAKRTNSIKQDQSYSQDILFKLKQKGEDATKQKGKGRNLRKRRISEDEEDLDPLQSGEKSRYQEETPLKKLKRGKKQASPSYDEDDEGNDDDDMEDDDLQGSEDEAKLLELEGKLENELAHLGEDGEDVDNFDEDDEENEDSEKMEDYVATERPIARLIKNQRMRDIENNSDSNLSEDPNYKKLTKRQKNIVKNNIVGQQEKECLELPSNSLKGKKNKLVSEEDQIKKLEKDEKRREYMHKQMEDLKRQTVDKILNEAGTKQKKRKEKEEMETKNKINHQFKQLPEREPRIRICNNASGTTVSITKTIFHPLLNPYPEEIIPIIPQIGLVQEVI